MKRSGSSLLSSVLILVIVTAGTPVVNTIAAQEESNESADNFAEPLPYEREEFPEWAWDIRRGEIIAFGAFPIAMILSGISLQLGRFAVKSLEAGGYSEEYAPFFLSTRAGPRYNEDERVGLLISAGVISLGVALADYILGRRERRSENGR